MTFRNIANALMRQKQFSDLFFAEQDLTDAEKEEITKTFILSMHAELSDLVSAINYKDHRTKSHPVNTDKILYKSVDVFRYLLAILNLWSVDSDEFITACEDKDMFLHARHKLSSLSDQDKPVVIFDVDDVIADFREQFNKWLNEKYKVSTDPDSEEYYNTVGLVDVGLEPEGVFREFISSGGFRGLKSDSKIVTLMEMLRDNGYWVHLLTARPGENSRVLYDTYSWLASNDVPHDAVDFSGEKFRWVADQKFFNESRLVCAIDDSPKHCAEYAKHGVKVIAPVKSYNKEVHSTDGVTMVDFKNTTSDEMFELIERMKDEQLNK